MVKYYYYSYGIAGKDEIPVTGRLKCVTTKENRLTAIKRLAALFTLLLASLVCADETKVIAFAQDTMDNDYRKAQVFEVRDKAAQHPQLAFVYSDAKGQTSLLIRQIERFIARRVDVLIVGTNDADAVVPAVSEACRAGIPVIILDRGIRSDEYTVFINSDNIRIGAMGAEYIAGRLGGKGTVLLLEGLPKADVTQLRSKGFAEQIARYPGIRVIRRTGNYLRRDTILVMEKLLAEGVRFDAIFSESDSMLSGVRSVMRRYQIDPSQTVMVGCDYTGEARKAILEGTQTASIRFPLGGDRAVETALKILAGKPVPRHIVIPVELVTRENVNDVPPVF
jgi:ribose transport system substrate-binding protein